MSQLQGKRVAIVHDWLYGGGAELVVEQLHKLFPEAPIYTSYCSDEWRRRLDNTVVTGFLQHQPWVRLRKFVPFLRIWWFGRLKLDGYDLVISSSGAEAKGIRVPKGTLHVNYCHAPTHYYWSRYDEYMQHPGFGSFDWLARLGLRLLVGPLRRWDYKAAQRPDVMLANSTHIQHEIQKYYHRESTVVFPPVGIERFAEPGKQAKQRHGFIIMGRQVPYKRFDLAVAACSELNLPLIVLGDGPDNTRLRSLAGPTVQFLGRVSDELAATELASAYAFIFPGIDDFGIAPVEALAAGTPVVAYKAGGALDYVTPGVTGEFFTEQTVTSLGDVLLGFKTTGYDHAKIRTYAQAFSAEHFREHIQTVLQQAMKERST